MATDYRPGDVIMNKIELSSLDGKRTFDMSKQATKIDLYESVIQPLIHGEVIVVDSIGLLNGFPIIGEESLQLSFTTPGRRKIEHKFNVYAVDQVSIEGGNKTISYRLKLVSQEAYKNSAKLVNKRTKGNISDLISEIISSDLESEKRVQSEGTRGIDDHVLSNLTPLQAVDKLRHRAVSATNASSSYVFYESFNDGFSFVTLESMLAKAAKSPIGFFYDDALDTDILQSTFRDCIAYERLQTQNALEKIQAGALSNSVAKFDLITGAVTNIKYDSEQYEDIFASTGKTPRGSSPGFVKDYGKSTSRTFLVPYDSSGAENFIAEKVGVLHSFVDKISQNIVHILVHGDTDLKLGDGASVTVTAATGMTDKKTVTNRYAISKIRHMILNSNHPVYTQSMELLNNSFEA